MDSLHPRSSLFMILCLIFVSESFSAKILRKTANKNVVSYKFHFSEKYLGRNSKPKPKPKDFGLESTKTLYSRRMKRETFSDDPCYEYGLCGSNDNMETSICHCDPYCSHYGDCCYDVESNGLDMYPSIPELDFHKCVCMRGNEPFLCYNVVVRCSADYTDTEIIKQCGSGRSLFHKLPVWDDNGVTYYSGFCAICNNVLNYKPAEVTFDVKKCFKASGNFTNQLDDTDCKPTYNPPKGFFFRKCFYSSSVNKNEKCSKHQNPVQINKSWYKNYFCSFSANSVSGFKAQKYLCGALFVLDQMYDILPFTVMFTFSPPRIAKYKEDCKENEQYNDKMKICRKISCESGGEPYEGMCLGSESYTNYKFNINYRFFVNNTVEKRFLYRISNILDHILQYENYKITIENIIFVITHGLQPGSQNTCSDIAAQVAFNIGYRFLTIDIIEKLKSVMFDFQWTYLENVESNEQVTKLNTFLRFDQCNPINNVTIQRKWKKKQEQEAMVDLSQITNSQFCSDVHIKATLSENETTRITSRKCGKLSETKYIGNAGQSHPKFINFQTILTYVCMGLSCAALTISIFIYRVLDFSKSIPGSNTENLYITLLFAHVLYLIGIGANDNQTVCKCVGIVIHYFWLASFAFMTIAVLNIAVTFSKIIKSPNINRTHNKCLKRKFIIAGYTMPILVVFPCVVLDILNIPSFRMEYNGKVCFPTGYPANIIFVSGPMVLSVTINVICLLIVMCSIRRQTTNTKEIDKGFISYLPVYLRLSLLVGILWIFGIMSVVMTNEILENVFIALGSLHGFFVSVALTCTVRVYNSLKSRSKPSSNISQIPMENVANVNPE